MSERFFDFGADTRPNGHAGPRPTFKPVDRFCGEYEPLSYIVEPIIRTGTVTCLTAKTGGGKTGLAVVIAEAVATGRSDILGMDVVAGRVAYRAFENPDDVRMRIMVAAFLLNIELADIADSFVILDARTKPEDLIAELRLMSVMGEFSLVIVDTFAAAFDGKDVNDNVQAGEFVRRLRPITQLPGLPAVLIPAHPTKNASDDQLVPYGGGAILNEVDANLTLAKRSDTGNTVLHWQGKFRGLEFQPCTSALKLSARQTSSTARVAKCGFRFSDRARPRTWKIEHRRRRTLIVQFSNAWQPSRRRRFAKSASASEGRRRPSTTG